MSQISSVFDCLLEEEERCLKENPVDSVQWAEVVLTVNGVIKVRRRSLSGAALFVWSGKNHCVLRFCVQDLLQAAGQYRETKASMYRASENAAAEPEYIPWTGKTHLSEPLCDICRTFSRMEPGPPQNPSWTPSWLFEVGCLG